MLVEDNLFVMQNAQNAYNMQQSVKFHLYMLRS